MKFDVIFYITGRITECANYMKTVYPFQGNTFFANVSLFQLFCGFGVSTIILELICGCFGRSAFEDFMDDLSEVDEDDFDYYL